MAQNCPFLLLFAPLLPHKGERWALPKLHLTHLMLHSPQAPSHQQGCENSALAPADSKHQLLSGKKKPARAQVLTLPRHSRVAGDSIRVLVLLHDLLPVHPLVAPDDEVWCRHITAEGQLARILGDLSSNFWTCVH